MVNIPTCCPVLRFHTPVLTKNKHKEWVSNWKKPPNAGEKLDHHNFHFLRGGKFSCQNYHNWVPDCISIQWIGPVRRALLSLAFLFPRDYDDDSSTQVGGGEGWRKPHWLPSDLLINNYCTELGPTSYKGDLAIPESRKPYLNQTVRPPQLTTCTWMGTSRSSKTGSHHRKMYSGLMMVWWRVRRCF